MKTSLCLLLVGTLIGMMNFYGGENRGSGTVAATDWPSEFEGLPLKRMPLTDTESAFAESFPGAIGVFESPGGRQVILRRVDRATRRLHDSATCLKAAGFSIEERVFSEGWLHYEARKGADSFHVRERITCVSLDETNRSWTDVSDWFWHATFHRSAGPWVAQTVLDPID